MTQVILIRKDGTSRAVDIDYEPEDLPTILLAHEVGDDPLFGPLGPGPIPGVSGHRYRRRPDSEPPTYVEED
jgi:hypothetical protein